MLIFNVMEATLLAKKVGLGQQKAEKVSDT